jgi:replicative superfamily II helicase
MRTEDRENRLSLIQRLRNTPAGLDEVLEHTVLGGIAYHHAGLTTEERELIEEAYDQGILKVLAVTSLIPLSTFPQSPTSQES